MKQPLLFIAQRKLVSRVGNVGTGGLVEPGYWHPQNARTVEQTRCCDSIFCGLVFLQLMGSDVQLFGEVLLPGVEGEASLPDQLTDSKIKLGRSACGRFFDDYDLPSQALVPGMSLVIGCDTQFCNNCKREKLSAMRLPLIVFLPLAEGGRTRSVMHCSS